MSPTKIRQMPLQPQILSHARERGVVTLFEEKRARHPKNEARAMYYMTLTVSLYCPTSQLYFVFRASGFMFRSS